MSTAGPTPRFQLEIFEGPLDLLLHLIKKNEVDVYDIPISKITDQYLEVLHLLEDLNLDLAGEYLVMAATLMYIKSRMLLPPAEGEEEEDEDPRAELVQQLEEYRKFREAAEHLADRDVLHRDVFPRAPEKREKDPDDAPPLRELTMADLLEALRQVLERIPERNEHEIVSERVAIADRIPFLLDRLREGRVDFRLLFPGDAPRKEIIATFLALLELVRMRAVRALQEERFGAIWLELTVEDTSQIAITIDETYKD